MAWWEEFLDIGVYFGQSKILCTHLIEIVYGERNERITFCGDIGDKHSYP